MKGIKMTFGPKSAIVGFLKTNKPEELPWSLSGDKAVFEFHENAPARAKPISDYLKEKLREARSKTLAELSLDNLSFALRHQLEIPRDAALALAKALDRVRLEDRSVDFLYGKQGRRGRPEKELLVKFEIFQVVETLYSVIGRLDSSRGGEGAYDAAQRLLRMKGIFVEDDELRRIRRQVLTKAEQDIDYMFALFHFLKDRGYSIDQVA